MQTPSFLDAAPAAMLGSTVPSLGSIERLYFLALLGRTHTPICSRRVHPPHLRGLGDFEIVRV